MATVYEIITDRIVEMLKAGTVPWKKTWSQGTSSFPKNLVSKKEYRGINVFLLSSAGFTSPWWLSYKQATELGGQVKKGEKGFPAIFWKINKFEDKESGDEKTVPMIRYYTVFNSQQIDGIKVPEVKIETRPENQKLEEAEKIVLAYNNAPRIENGMDAAFYRPSTDMVGMPDLNRFGNPQEYYQTLFHELVHSTGHETRLKRKGVATGASFGSNPYAKEELVAEMGASFLSAHCGIVNSVIDNSASYIQGWLRSLQNDPKLVVDAAAAAQKAVAHILGIKKVGEEVA